MRLPTITRCSLLAIAFVCGGMASPLPGVAADPQFAALEKTATEAAAQRDAAAKVLSTEQAKARELSDKVLKLKADLARAQRDLPAAEADLKKQPALITKAKADQAKADADAAAAKKAAEAAKGDKAKADAATKATAAATTAAMAVTTATANEDRLKKLIESSKDAIAKSPALIMAAEKAVADFKPTLDKAQAAFDTVAADALAKQKALEKAMIGAGKLVSFTDSVAPIFAKRCLACHNARTAKGRYNMESFAAVMKGGESGAALEAGKSNTSTLVTMIEDGSMPKDADPLTKDQIATIKKWIDTGAKLDAGVNQNDLLISIMPKLPQPPAPPSYRVPIPITALAFSPDGTLLASSGYHELLLWNPADGKLVRRITNVAERSYALDFSKDGKQLAVAAGTPGEMGEVKIFDVATGALQADLVTSADSIFGVAFSPDGKKIAACGADRAVRVFDLATRKQLIQVEDHADWVMDIAWSPDGTKLASASRDKTSKVFDAVKGESLVTFNGHGQPVFGVVFAADGKSVATSGSDKQIRIWNPADGKAIRAIGGFGNEVFRIVLAPDGKLFSSSADNTAREHTAASGAAVKTYSGHKDWVYTVSYHAGSNKVASGSYDGEIRIWNAADGKLLTSFFAAPGYGPAAQAKK